MQQYYNHLVLIHVISASAYVMTMIIMQFVVANVMKQIPASEGKDKAILFIKTKWHPIVDALILTVGISGAIIGHINRIFILDDALFIAKVIFGILSLIAAYTNHFVLRYLKRALVASKKNPNLLNSINIVMPVLDKIALIFGVTAALIGWYINHF